MVWIKFASAFLFVIGISFVFYASEKYVLNPTAGSLNNFQQVNQKGLKFSVTNNINEGVPNAIVYISLDSSPNNYREVHLTNVTGETNFIKLDSGTYFWKVVSSDSTSLCQTGKTVFPDKLKNGFNINVRLEKAKGNFSKLSVN